MIAHARITSATEATVQFADRAEQITAATRNEVREVIKVAFITEARALRSPIDVVIFDGTARHALTVEPNGRIAPRTPDGRPLYAQTNGSATEAPGPVIGAPASASDHSSAASAASAPSADSAPSAGSAASAASPAQAPRDKDGETGTDQRDEAAAERPRPTAPVPHEPEVARGRYSADESSERPTLDDLRAGSAAARKPVANRGFNKFIRHATFGAIRPGPGRSEREDLDRIATIRTPLDTPKNIAVVNLKGGAHKTTSVLMIAATLGMFRGGSVLAWDNNETRGTLGWRGIPSDHTLTALDLLHNLDHFRRGDAKLADLDRYVRPQGDMNFDILASDEDPGSASSIDGKAFTELNDVLSRFYRVKVVDTGNNVRASNWLAAVEGADQLVIVSTVREDTFNAAAWMIDELRLTGHGSQVDKAVTVLSRSSRAKIDRVLHKRLLHHFGAHTRAVVEVPFEEHFVDGGSLDWSKLSKQTREAWIRATAVIAEGL